MIFDASSASKMMLMNLGPSHTVLTTVNSKNEAKTIVRIVVLGVMVFGSQRWGTWVSERTMAKHLLTIL